jgi:CBS domain-containing protein
VGTRLKDFATQVVAVVEPETTALVVVDALDKTRPVGIVTDRDLVLELMAEGLGAAVFTAGDIMSVDLVLAHPDMDAMDAAQLMSTHGLRRLVITDEAGRLAGIVTLEDVLDLLARELLNLSASLANARQREQRQRPSA